MKTTAALALAALLVFSSVSVNASRTPNLLDVRARRSAVLACSVHCTLRLFACSILMLAMRHAYAERPMLASRTFA